MPPRTETKSLSLLEPISDQVTVLANDILAKMEWAFGLEIVMFEFPIRVFGIDF